MGNHDSRNPWTQAASIEETLCVMGGVASGKSRRGYVRCSGKSVLRRMQACFWKVCSEMSTAKRVGCAQRAAGDPGPWRQQAILGRRDWDADGLRDIVRDYVIEHLADDDAVLVIDETGFLKQGKASCGVARQYTGSAGKITNCQIGVFAAYPVFAPRSRVHRSRAVSSEGMDRRSRSPGSRIHVPSGVGFATKPQLATRMIAHAIAVLPVPFKWVAGDTVCGVGDIAQHLCRVEQRLPRTRGQQRSCVSFLGQAAIRRRQGCGHCPDAALVRAGNACRQGPEPKDRGCMIGCYLELADLEVEEFSSANQGLWTARSLLIRRRHITDGDLAFFTTWCPAATSIETLVAVEGHPVGDRGQF